MSEPTNFNDPFDETPRSERHRTTIEIPLKVASAIKKYEPKTGVLQTTVGILLSKFHEQLTNAGIEEGDRHAYHNAVVNATIKLGGRGKRSTATKPAAGSQPPKPIETAN